MVTMLNDNILNLSQGLVILYYTYNCPAIFTEYFIRMRHLSILIYVKLADVLQLMLEIFLFTTVSRTALEPTQPPIQWVPRALWDKAAGA
jgi:hypothetical protein